MSTGMRVCMALVVLSLLAAPAFGLSVPVSFTKLSGLTGGSPAMTAVYRADLSGLGLAQVASIMIQDNSQGLGGSPGMFSGFDLDAIVLSNTSVGTAPDAQALSGLPVFDFSPAGTFFTPGVQRPPPDPALFGTLGGNIDNSVATLGSFDGNSTTAIPAPSGSSAWAMEGSRPSI